MIWTSEGVTAAERMEPQVSIATDTVKIRDL